MIILGYAVERSPGVAHCAGHITDRYRVPGPIDGNESRQTAKLRLICNDHLSQWKVRGIQPPLGITQTGFYTVDLAVRKEGPRIAWH